MSLAIEHPGEHTLAEKQRKLSEALKIAKRHANQLGELDSEHRKLALDFIAGYHGFELKAKEAP